MTVHRMNSKVFPLILGSLIAVAVVGFYWPVLVKLFEVMLDNEDTSYGVILPLVSAFIIYKKWPQLRSQPLEPSWSGLVILLGGFGLFIFGKLFESLYIPSISFLVVLAGLLVLVGGFSLLRLLAFPLAILLFMIPYQGYFTNNLTFPLQLISSKLAAFFLRVCGVTLHLQGNIIDLGNRQLNVVAACSGLRYVVNLMALGVIFCYFFQRRPWKVAVILVSLIPFAIFANAFRIATIGLFPIFEKGLWHSSIGLAIFLLGFDYLKLINWSVNRHKSPTQKPSLDKTQVQGSPSPISLNTLNRRLIAGLVLVLLCGPLTLAIAEPREVPLLQSFSHFPLEIGNWRGNREYIDNPKTLKVLAADSYLDVKFMNGEGKSVGLWVAYYENQSLNKFLHRPQLCLRGSGWHVKQTGIVNIKADFPVLYTVVEQEGYRLLVYYWYVQCGRHLLAEKYKQRFYLAFDGLVKHRSDGALVRLETPVNNDLPAAKARLTSFGSLIVPILKQYIP